MVSIPLFLYILKTQRGMPGIKYVPNSVFNRLYNGVESNPGYSDFSAANVTRTKYEIRETATDINHLIFTDMTQTRIGMTYSYSALVESIGGRNVRLADLNGSGAAIFELSGDGTILSSDNPANIKKVRDNVYLIWMTITRNNSNLSRIALYSLDGTTITFLGETNKGFNCYNIAVEEGDYPILIHNYLSNVTRIKPEWFIGDGTLRPNNNFEKYWSTTDPIKGGYTIYNYQEGNGPTRTTAYNDNELISHINSMSGNNFTDVSDAINWANSNVSRITTDLQLEINDTSYLTVGTTTILDRSSNGYPLSLLDGVGFSDRSFDFNGLGSSIELGNPGSGFLQSGQDRTQITIETYIYFNSIGTNQTIFQTGGKTNGGALGLLANGNVRFLVRKGGTTVGGVYDAYVESGSLQPNIWYHILGTKTASTMSLYINGSLVDTINTTFVWNTGNTVPNSIGMNILNDDTITGGNAEAPLDGKIYMFRIYSIGLSEISARNNYNSFLKTLITNDEKVGYVSNNLALNLDATNINSYTGTTNNWYSMSEIPNTSTLINGITYSNIKGGSLTFDGTNDYIDTEVNSLFDAYNTDKGFAFELLIKFNSATSAVLIGNLDQTNEWVQFPISTGNVYLYTEGLPSPNNQYLTGFFKSQSSILHKWWHVVVNAEWENSNNSFIMVNGTDDTNLNIMDTMIKPTSELGASKFRIGVRNTTVWPFDGEMKIARYYNKSLSRQEVLQNFDYIKNIITDPIHIWDASKKECFDSTNRWLDISGSKGHGNIINTVTKNNIGTNNGYLSFNHDNEDSISNMAVGNEPKKTVIMWIRNSNTVDNQALFGFGTSNTNALNLLVISNKFGFNSYAGDVYGLNNANTLILDGEWHQIVAEVDFTSITNSKIWIDGVSQILSQVQGTPLSRPQSNNFTIGSLDYRATGYSWGGDIALVEIYANTISQHKIDSNYREMLYKKHNILTLSGFNRESWIGQGNTWYDVSGNNFNGDLSNGTFTNKWLTFNAPNELLLLPINDNNVGYIDGTISVWFKSSIDRIPNQEPVGCVVYFSDSFITSSETAIAFGNWTSSFPDEFLIVGISGGYGYYNVNDLPISEGKLVADRWYNIVMTRDSSGTSIYFNGTLLGAPSYGLDIRTRLTTTHPFIPTTHDNVQIGRLRSSTNYWNGGVSNIEVHDIALPELTIIEKYNEMAERLNAPNSINYKLLAHLDVTNSDSYKNDNTFYDLSGNENHFSIGSGLSYTDGYIRLNQAVNCEIGLNRNPTSSNSITITYWIKTTDTQALLLSNSFNSTGYVGAYRSTTVYYDDRPGTTRLFIDNIQTTNLFANLPNDQWHFVEIKDLDILSLDNLYINYYGGYQFDNTTYLGAFRVYDRNLTEAESEYIYNSEKHKYIRI